MLETPKICRLEPWTSAKGTTNREGMSSGDRSAAGSKAGRAEPPKPLKVGHRVKGLEPILLFHLALVWQFIFCYASTPPLWNGNV